MCRDCVDDIYSCSSESLEPWRRDNTHYTDMINCVHDSGVLWTPLVGTQGRE